MKLQIPFKEAKERFTAIQNECKIKKPNKYDWDKEIDLSRKYKNCIMPWAVFRLYFFVKNEYKYLKNVNKDENREKLIGFWNDIFYIKWEAFDKAYHDLRIYDAGGILNYSEKLKGTYDNRLKAGRELSQQMYNKIMQNRKWPENKESIDPFLKKGGVDLALLEGEEKASDLGDIVYVYNDDEHDGNSESYVHVSIRKGVEIDRIVRNTKLVRMLKKEYDDRCQICGYKVELKGRNYSEGHHLRPLGTPHNGPDIAGNIIIVCPNCHAKLDYEAIEIQSLNISSKHKIGKKYIEYHNKLVDDN